MDFTREPIIETIITPKTGCKLVVRSSKSAGQEEYFVDSVEVVAFGNALFFRSIERPKAFLVPVSDYEVIEVREARLVLKNVGIDRTIKIGGGREPKPSREPIQELAAPPPELESPPEGAAERMDSTDQRQGGRVEKRKEKRRHSRRRRGRDEAPEENLQEVKGPAPIGESLPEELVTGAVKNSGELSQQVVPPFSALLPPPPTLISDTIARYRENFKDAFFVRGEESSEALISPEQEGMSESRSEELLEALEMQKVTLEPSDYGSFEPVEEEPWLSDSKIQIGDEEAPKPPEV